MVKANMHQRRFVISAFLLAWSMTVLPVGRAAGEEVSEIDIESITLEDAVELAINNSTSIREIRISVSNSETKLSEETPWHWLRPNISLKGGVDSDTGDPEVSLGVGIDLKDILGGGKKRIRNLKFSISEDRKNIESLKASIRINVTGAFREYEMIKEKIGFLEESIRENEIGLEGLEGPGRQTERLLLRSILNQDRLALISARQERLRIETTLRSLIGFTQ